MRRLRCATGTAGTVGTVALIAVLPGPAGAQAPSKSAEVRHLEFYVGQWSTSGQMRDDPGKPFEPVTGIETCTWAAGGYAVLCQEKVAGAGGGWEGVYILSYDPENGRYQVYGTEMPGTSMHASGRLDGDRWVWETDPAPDGSRLRYTFVPAGEGVRTMAVEAGAGDEWFEVLEMTYTPVD